HKLQELSQVHLNQEILLSEPHFQLLESLSVIFRSRWKAFRDVPDLGFWSCCLDLKLELVCVINVLIFMDSLKLVIESQTIRQLPGKLLKLDLWKTQR
ncbi:hypothetical protein TNCT_452021, partial [Trichonephila clavata]